MGEKGRVFKVLVGNLRERDHLEDPGVDSFIHSIGMCRMR